MLFFNQLSRHVRGDGCGFELAATVDLAHMLDHADLHWHDLEILADSSPMLCIQQPQAQVSY